MLNNKRLIIYFLFSASLFFGFLFGENSSGGGKFDHEYLIPYIKNFSLDFKVGLNTFIGNGGSLMHSPAFYLIFGFFLKITNNILLIKYFYIFISCLIPYFFYLIIKIKYRTNSEYIFYLSLIIFISPYFRSSAIWLLGDNLSLLFFSLSILFYLKTNDQKEVIINYYLCFIFLILCCYIRYYYCIFAIYFLINFYKDLNLKSFLKIIIVATILSLPAIFYFYYVIVYYNFFNALSKFGYVNYFSTSLVILSIILFYLFPFVFTKSHLFLEFYRKRLKNIFILFLPFLSLYLIDNLYLSNLINISSYGGGVLIKFCKLINFNIDLFISITAFISLLVIDFLFKNNRLENYALLVILILCFPLFSIYQKYLDPLFYLFFLGLINSSYFKEIITKRSIALSFFYGYFLTFLLFALSYY